MITPADLRDPGRLSGYKYVYRSDASTERGHGGGKPYQAMTGGGSTAPSNRFYGPRRATALEAAQDYCDYRNGQAAPTPPVLKSAGHKRSATLATRKPSKALVKARKRVRALEAQEREGSQGFLYLIGMEFQTLYPSTEAGKVYIWTHAVKIGWSEAPDARIASLQTGNPQKLVLLATKPGTLDDERALHAKYLPDNVLQEWFRPTMALLLEFGLRQTLRGEDRLLVEGVVTP